MGADFLTKQEIEKLFSLLACYFPNAKQVQAGNLPIKTAWYLAVEPYKYEDMKAAAVAYVRRNKFFPDVADLMALCPETAEAMTPRKRAVQDKRNEDMRRDLEELARLIEEEPHDAEEILRCGGM